MNKMSLPTIGILSLLVAAPLAQAVPVISPKCATSVRVVPASNGSGVFFNDTCDTAYVLPPVTGAMELAALAPNLNLESCSQLTDTMRIGKAMSERVRKMAEAANAGSGGGTIGSSGPLGRLAAGAAPVTPGADNMDAVAVQLKKLTEAQAQIRELLAPYEQLEGATAQIIYSVPMAATIAEYQQKNPKIRFERLPLSTSYLSIVSKESPVGGKSNAVLSVEVPGLGVIPTHAGDALTGDAGATKIFGDSLSGQVRLSVFGACPFMDGTKLKSLVTPKEFGAHLSANVQYTYEMQAHRKYRATYNLASLVKKMKSTSSSGGFFSTKTATSIVEERDSKSWFDLDQDSNDSRVAYDDLSKSIKADLMDRVMSQITLTTVGLPLDIADPGKPKTNGASALASGVRNNCAHIYCQAGAAVLDVFNAVFGSESTVSNFISTNDHWATDDVSDRRMVPFQGSYSFTK